MITRDGAKMSKSKGNVVCPRAIVERYGADTARAYILFIGPPDQDADWTDEGVEGMHRFLGRLWRLSAEVAERTAGARPTPAPAPARATTSRCCARRTGRSTRSPATSPAASPSTPRSPRSWSCSTRSRAGARAAPTARCASRSRPPRSLIFPFAPHAGADAYELLTGERVWEQPWPEADPAFLESDTFELVVQVNGKVRDRVEAPADAPREQLEPLARGGRTCARTSTATRSSR